MEISNPLSHAQLEERSVQLRAELKQWERDFAASHAGRKAGREDIKQHPEIASKYKIYDKIRQSLTQPSKLDLKPTPPAGTKKRLSAFTEDLPTIQTPSKRAKHAHPLHSHPANTFATHPLHPAVLDPYDPPASSLLSPSKARTSLGPTPQRDGKVLGLFDVLSSGSLDRTPRKSKILNPAAGNVQATPSKRVGGAQTLPGSATKRDTVFGTVITPSTHRIAKSTPTPTSRSGVSKLRFDDTPAFLRRDSQRAVLSLAEHDENDGVSLSPVAHRRMGKLFRPGSRGLSALVKGLRDMEEAKHDEDLDMLREMEGGSTFESFASRMNHQAKVQPPKILVGDSQIPELPLGPDGAMESEDEIGMNEGKTRDGRPLKVWKKKGQKRTTRAVKMRPNAAKWKPEPAWKGGVEPESDREGDAVGAEQSVGETQVIGPGNGQAGNGLLNEDDEYAGGPDEDEEEYAAQPDMDDESDDMETKMAAWRKQKRDVKEQKESDKKDGIVQRVKKKISATAHANFRALKIRNKNSKGKGASRFGRRRG